MAQNTAPTASDGRSGIGFRILFRGPARNLHHRGRTAGALVYMSVGFGLLALIAVGYQTDSPISGGVILFIMWLLGIGDTVSYVLGWILDDPDTIHH